MSGDKIMDFPQGQNTQRERDKHYDSHFIKFYRSKVIANYLVKEAANGQIYVSQTNKQTIQFEH